MERKKLRIILEIIITVFYGISFLLYAAPFITYGASSVNVSGFQLLFNNERYWKSSDWGNLYLFCNFIIVLVLFLTILIISILDNFTKIKVFKNDKLTKRKAKVLLVLSIIVCIALVIFNFDINLNISSMSGVLSKTSATSASGAIFSSIFFAIGMIFNVVFGYINRFENALKSNDSFDRDEIDNQKDNKAIKAENKSINTLDQTISNKTIEEQLLELKSLKEKGLITEEDYNKKKNQLLGL